MIVGTGSTKIPVALQVFRSALYVSYDKHAYTALHGEENKTEVKRSPRHYAVFYANVNKVDVLPNGLAFYTTVRTGENVERH